MHRVKDPNPIPDEKEREIMLLLSHGDGYEGVARRYATTIEAVKTRVYRMRLIFGVDDNAAMVALALRNDWIR